MLRREEELRLSAAVQERYAAVEIDSSDLDWMHVTEELQRQVVREFGATEDTEVEALMALRHGATKGRYQSLYVRYQRARQGELLVGDRVPNCRLVDVEMKATSLHDEIDDQRPVCLLAGSYS